MAIDSFMYFKDYNGKFLMSESQVDLKGTPANELLDDFSAAHKAGGLFEVEDYSFDVEQVLSIGSQSSGAGAGKITFNPFSITRSIDKSSPVLYQNCCSGTPYQDVGLGMRKSAGGEVSGTFFLYFQFKLVAVKTISWSHDDESPKETTTFEYGGLVIRYGQQKADGKINDIFMGGWNKVKNVNAKPADVIK